MSKRIPISQNYSRGDIKVLLDFLHPNHILRAVLPTDKEALDTFANDYASPDVLEMLGTEYTKLPLLLNDPIAQSPFYKWRFKIGR